MYKQIKAEIDERIESGELVELEDISSQSCKADCRHRLWRRSDADFRNLYCFIILLHDRRKVAHFNVTARPTAEWTARQLIEAFPEDRGAARNYRGAAAKNQREPGADA